MPEPDINHLHQRCSSRGVPFRVKTDTEGECLLIVDGRPFADLDEAMQYVEQLDRVLG